MTAWACCETKSAAFVINWFERSTLGIIALAGCRFVPVVSLFDRGEATMGLAMVTFQTYPQTVRCRGVDPSFCAAQACGEVA